MTDRLIIAFLSHKVPSPRPLLHKWRCIAGRRLHFHCTRATGVFALGRCRGSVARFPRDLEDRATLDLPLVEVFEGV